jgi:anti-anti-sigma factor
MGSVKVGAPGAAVVVHLNGEFDMAATDELQEALELACKRTAGLVVVDLWGTTFIDSNAIGVLAATGKRLAESDCRIVLVNVGELPARPLRRAGLWDVLEAHEVSEELPEEVAAALAGTRPVVADGDSRPGH